MTNVPPSWPTDRGKYCCIIKESIQANSPAANWSHLLEVRKIEHETHPCYGQYGLFALANIEMGREIACFCGDLTVSLSMEEFLREKDDEKVMNRVWLYDGVDIDASECGNELKFINDYRNIRATPNCCFALFDSTKISKKLENKSVDLEGSKQVVLIAREEISKGEELLVSYGEDYWTLKKEREAFQFGLRCQGVFHVDCALFNSIHSLSNINIRRKREESFCYLNNDYFEIIYDNEKNAWVTCWTTKKEDNPSIHENFSACFECDKFGGFHTSRKRCVTWRLVLNSMGMIPMTKPTISHDMNYLPGITYFNEANRNRSEFAFTKGVSLYVAWRKEDGVICFSETVFENIQSVGWVVSWYTSADKRIAFYFKEHLFGGTQESKYIAITFKGYLTAINSTKAREFLENLHDNMYNFPKIEELLPVEPLSDFFATTGIIREKTTSANGVWLSKFPQLDVPAYICHWSSNAKGWVGFNAEHDEKKALQRAVIARLLAEDTDNCAVGRKRIDYTSGVDGVSYEKTRKIWDYWIASWYDAEGKRMRRSFSCQRLGFYTAKAWAIRTRRIAELRGLVRRVNSSFSNGVTSTPALNLPPAVNSALPAHPTEDSSNKRRRIEESSASLDVPAVSCVSHITHGIPEQSWT